jgi:hypothetical protein
MPTGTGFASRKLCKMYKIINSLNLVVHKERLSCSLPSLFESLLLFVFVFLLECVTNACIALVWLEYREKMLQS